ncbi:hypothetical protein RSSM_00977 [Rhodopirellula sallentina SM41]|uniref:Uncharacterized protein n=1 Tax=Rhodopirellula sallentina SM41 TaxID=1263870 RepID=M5U7Y5_9BACT|nr:hypothetical protein RSSM_00977 [Rhodopirellula sallentina SM41]
MTLDEIDKPLASFATLVNSDIRQVRLLAAAFTRIQFTEFRRHRLRRS